MSINIVGSVALWIVSKGIESKERIRLDPPPVELTIGPLRAHRNQRLTYISSGEAVETVLRFCS